MPNSNNVDPAALARIEASQRSMEQGGLPLNAIDRLRDQAARQGTSKHIFTSDLSVNELLLARTAGCEPLGQVMGSSVFHIGYQWQNAYFSGQGQEMDVLTRAHYSVRHLALSRMQQEAALLGASGVVGVRLEQRSYEWGGSLLEFAAIGTAIREVNSPPSKKVPFLSDLSGQEFMALRQAGYEPAGFCLGNCTYFQIGSWSTQSATGNNGFWGTGFVNQELTDFTQALYFSRELAMTRMEHEARQASAGGIVGVKVEMDARPVELGDENNRRIAMMFHFTAIGTAIKPYADLHNPLQVVPVLSLKDDEGGIS